MSLQTQSLLSANKAADESRDPVYLRIRDLVYQTCGIYHTEEKLYLLAGACKRRMTEAKIGGAKAYFDTLTRLSTREVELRQLLNEITIGETSLFRSQGQLEALKNVLLPKLTEERSKLGLRRLRIWSAGCSTGEEPYTLAMFFAEERERKYPEWTFEILVASSTPSNAVQVLTRAISIGTEGANGTVSPSDRQAIAGEVQGLLQQLVSLGNTQYQGTYLFSGTAVTTQSFTLDPVTQAVTYNGNPNSNPIQLSNGTSVQSGIPGSQLFQNAAGSAFAALQSLYNSLQSGNNIGAAVTSLQNALSQVSVQRVFYGNALNQINTSESFLNQEKINLSTQKNGLVGVDPPVAATSLAQSQTSYQANLAATSRILGLPTLLDFLK